ncbi:unnamed protein product [Penicillium egyptiacum]|uniref:C2H2-type domain-containing protein n=1 Tax=Penicillium egyptiacum TaxID=1303716 RepID=A0A9W4P0U5_9EURO|nr:unnamed protein product [Penicillium egyptiacum]
MFPGGPGSQEPFSSRNQSNLPTASDSQSNVGLSSPLVQSAETPDFAQSVLPRPDSHWPVEHIQSSISAVQGGSQSTGFAQPLPSHRSTTLNPGTSQPHTLPGLNYPPTEPTEQSCIEDTAPIKEEIESEDPRICVDKPTLSTFATTRTNEPAISIFTSFIPSIKLSDGLSQSPKWAATWIPTTRTSTTGVLSRSTWQSFPSQSASKVSRLITWARKRLTFPIQSTPRPSFPPSICFGHSSARAASDDVVCRTSARSAKDPIIWLLTSRGSPPPYMINQPAYYFPDTSPIPSHPTSMSSQPPSMTAPEPMCSSPESAAATDSDPARALNLRPRPQCWDHGCNGREFSTFSNLLRHQREKSGVVAKAECPICGAVFTRTTARNIHVAQGKCKSSGRESPAE